MPVTETAVQAFLSRISQVREITSRKMFGGVGLYDSGVFFALIDDDRLYFKSDAISDALYDPFEAEPWLCPGPNGLAVMPYREVPASVLADDEQLGHFIDAALEVVARKAVKKKK